MPFSGLVPRLVPIHSFIHSPGVLGHGDTELRGSPLSGGNSVRRENPGSGEHLPQGLVSMAQAQDPGCVGGLRELCVSPGPYPH